jgi:hypothetical protein
MNEAPQAGRNEERQLGAPSAREAPLSRVVLLAVGSASRGTPQRSLLNGQHDAGSLSRRPGSHPPVSKGVRRTQRDHTGSRWIPSTRRRSFVRAIGGLIPP